MGTVSNQPTWTGANSGSNYVHHRHLQRSHHGHHHAEGHNHQFPRLRRPEHHHIHRQRRKLRVGPTSQGRVEGAYQSPARPDTLNGLEARACCAASPGVADDVLSPPVAGGQEYVCIPGTFPHGGWRGIRQQSGTVLVGARRLGTYPHTLLALSGALGVRPSSRVDDGDSWTWPTPFREARLGGRSEHSRVLTESDPAIESATQCRDSAQSMSQGEST